MNKSGASGSVGKGPDFWWCVAPEWSPLGVKAEFFHLPGPAPHPVFDALSWRIYALCDFHCFLLQWNIKV